MDGSAFFGSSILGLLILYFALERIFDINRRVLNWMTRSAAEKKEREREKTYDARQKIMQSWDEEGSDSGPGV